MTDFDYKRFPSTRYQGSKRKLLPWIKGRFEKLEFYSCLDIFGGTGAVSYLFKIMGKQVTFNDYLKSNFICAKALVKNNNIRLDEISFSSLFSSQTKPGIVTEVFDGIFYPKEENIEIDTIIHNICFNCDTKLSGYKKDIALFTLFQALLMKRPFNLFHRANLNLRTNNAERSFGNYTTWETPFNVLMDRARTEANDAILNNGQKHIVLNLDALKVKPGYDLVYMDPPYYPNKKSRSKTDYYRFYHFLEGVSDYKSWEAKIEYSYKPRPILRDDASFTRETFIENLKELLSIHQESIIVMSYKNPGYPSIRKIKDLMSETHIKPRATSIEHNYSLNKNNGHYRENIIIAQPRT